MTGGTLPPVISGMPDLTTLLLVMPPLLGALVLHEVAHAWVADRLGDDTARLQGRLTLNPLAHLDPIGTVVLIVTQRIGWARPVPVDVSKLRDPRRDLFWIASAGPISNLLQAAVWGGAIRLMGVETFRRVAGGYHPGAGDWQGAFVLMLFFAFQINIVLAWFNLLPIPPLDGSRLVLRFLSPGSTDAYLQFSRYGMLVLVAVIFVAPQLLWSVLGPPVGWTAYLLGGVRIF